MSNQTRQQAAEIIEKTSVGRRRSEAQVSILAFLLKNTGEWVTHEKLIEQLKEENVFDKEIKPFVARTRIQQILQSLDKKLKEYSLREDRQPELGAPKIERKHGRGIRLVTPQIKTNVIGYGYPRNPNRDSSNHEILAWLKTIEEKVDESNKKMDSLLTILSRIEKLLERKGE